jgi:Glyoxalase-like domain
MTSTQIDHIVLLVSTPFFEDPPSWLTSNFTITPGGSHTGQPSRNKLIIFADGTYLELFNWYDTPPPLSDENLPMRFWGPKKEGLIDFALTSSAVSAEECIGTVNEKFEQGLWKDAGLGVRYQSPVAGSRTRGDGVEAKWKVTRPVFGGGENVLGEEMFPGGRMDAPFFCHDVTERGYRVACEDEKKTTHACGAKGIAAIEVLVPGERMEEYAILWGKIVGSEAKVRGAGSGGNECVLDVGVPKGGGRSKIVLREARSEKDLLRMKERGIGFSDLVIATEGRGDCKRQQFGPEGVGPTIWLE